MKKGVVKMSKKGSWKLEAAAFSNRWALHPKRYSLVGRNAIKQEAKYIIQQYESQALYLNATMFEQAVRKAFPEIFSGEDHGQEITIEHKVTNFIQSRVSASGRAARRVVMW